MPRKRQHGGKRPGAGRSPKHQEGKTIKLVANVPEMLVDELELIAEVKGWSRSAAVTDAIRQLVKSFEGE